MRKLPDTMAKMLANLTNGSGAAGSGGGQAGGAAASAPGGQQRNWSGGAGSGGAGPGAAGGDAGAARPAYGAPGGQSGQGGDWASRRSGGGDLQQMLSRAPAIHLTDLQKGEAVMLVSTQGTSEVTAVTLLAGVEPLLQAPASTQNMLLSGWNMSSGSAEAAQ